MAHDIITDLLKLKSELNRIIDEAVELRNEHTTVSAYDNLVWAYDEIDIACYKLGHRE